MSEAYELDSEPAMSGPLADLYHKLPLEWKANLWGKSLVERHQQRLLPPAIYLELTSACNLNCVMCPTQRDEVRRHRADGFMDPGLFRRLVDEIAAEDPRTKVGLHKDGEPMLHPQIVELVEYATARLENVALITNGTLMSEEKARALLKTRLASIRFSVDGLTRETFEKVRRQSPQNPYADSGVGVDYESVHANVLRLCRIRSEMGASSPRVGVRVTDFAATRDEIARYEAYWKERVDFVEVARLLSWTGQVGRGQDAPAPPAVRYPCMALWTQLVVSWDGRVVPCCVYVDVAGDRKGVVADVNRTSLKDAAYAPRLERIRLAHLDGDLAEVAPFCEPCRDWRSPTPIGDVVWNEALTSQMRARCSTPTT